MLVACVAMATSPPTHASGGETPVLAEIQFGTTQSLLSPAYITQHKSSCLMLLRHLILCAFALARPNAGRSIAAKIAMIAITTKSSIKVKAAFRPFTVVFISKRGIQKKSGRSFQRFFAYCVPLETLVQPQSHKYPLTSPV